MATCNGCCREPLTPDTVTCTSALPEGVHGNAAAAGRVIESCVAVAAVTVTPTPPTVTTLFAGVALKLVPVIVAVPPGRSVAGVMASTVGVTTVRKVTCTALEVRPSLDAVTVPGAVAVSVTVAPVVGATVAPPVVAHVMLRPVRTLPDASFVVAVSVRLPGVGVAISAGSGEMVTDATGTGFIPPSSSPPLEHAARTASTAGPTSLRMRRSREGGQGNRDAGAARVHQDGMLRKYAQRRGTLATASREELVDAQHVQSRASRGER